MTDSTTGAGVPRPRWRIALDVVATLAIIGAAFTIIVRFGVLAPAPTRPVAPAIPIPTEPLSLDTAPTLGSDEAPVVIIEFSDFQCPFCGRFVKETLQEVRTKYIDSGRVQLVFRHLPLPIHPRARRAAESAACAAEQGRFWAMHDALFSENPGHLEEDDLRTYAASSSLDLPTFETCLSGGAGRNVESDLALAKTLKLTGTPAFLAGRRTAGGRVQVSQVIRGAVPATEFARVLDGLLN